MKGFGWFALSLALASGGRAETVVFPLPDSPATLDWTAGVTTTEGPIIHLIAEGLFRYDYPSGKLVPAIAERVEKSKDLRQYTFHIRRDARWSDGTPVRAQDFLDGWLRVLSPGSTSLYNFYLFDIENAREYFKKTLSEGEKLGIEVRGERTLVVRLARSLRSWEATTAFWPLFPVRKDLVSKHGTGAWKAGVIPSTGPFVLETLEPEKEAVLKRNPHYRGPGSNVDRVIVAFDRDPDSLREKFEKGFYTFVPNPGVEVRKPFLGGPKLKSHPILRNHALVSNAEKFPMSSRDFRKAIFLSLDRKRILEKSGVPAEVSRNMIPAPLPGSEWRLIPEYDPAVAKRTLQGAGVVVGKGLQLRLLTRIDPVNVSVAAEIQNQILRTLGFTIQIEALQEKEFAMMANLNEYDLILVGWSAKVRAPEDFLRPYSPLASNSRLRFKSPVFLEYLEEGLAAGSARESLEAFRKAQVEYLQNETVMMPLFDEKFSTLEQAGIENLYFDHMGFPVLRGLRVASVRSEKPGKGKR